MLTWWLDVWERWGPVLSAIAVEPPGARVRRFALVEVLQYALDLGRVSSVDDVLLNTAGALLAAACSYRWWRRAG
ncbi:VanZ family protein [Antribacter sp. KLBMP9083]|uniref:VanZ family protein n=1 Tax=Antribacter soli TaxID=2910976 RepID=A0AA41QGY6_9MICO|nr:VanZ family protein [Antribacter soli]MCF4123280.1 VanZ family protein [Antribacter soli]